MSIPALDATAMILTARNIRKSGFVPSQGAVASDPAAMGGGAPPAPGGGAPPPPPPAGGGAPPMDPSMGGAPPVDPSMGGAPPMDPSMGGAPPMDPTMMPAPDGSMPFGQPGGGGGGGGSGKGGKGNNDEIIKTQQLVAQCLNEVRMTRDLLLDMMQQQGMKVNPDTLRSGMAAADNIVSPQPNPMAAQGAM